MSKSHPKEIDYECGVAFYLREIDPAQARTVEAWLRAHPELAQRARRDAEIQAQIKHHFDGVLDEPIPQRLLAVGRHRQLHWPKRLATAAVIVAAASGGWWLGASQPGHPAATPDFSQRVAALWHNQPQRVVQSKVVSATPVRPPDLSARGYRLAASQVLRRGERPLTEFLYRNNRGAQVKIYAQTRSNRLTHRPTVSMQNGIPLARWRYGDVDYALVGNMPSAALQSLARVATGARTKPAAHAPPRNRPSVKPLPGPQGSPAAVPGPGNSAQSGAM